MFNAIEKGTLSKSNGMPISDVGAAWSKVLNPAPRIQGQSIDTVRRELGQNDPFLVKENSLQDPSVYTLLPWDASTRPTSGHTAKVDIGAVVDYWLKKGDVYFLDGYYHMATASPVFLFREYSFPTDSQSLSFDFLLENPLPEDELWFLSDLIRCLALMVVRFQKIGMVFFHLRRSMFLNMQELTSGLLFFTIARRLGTELKLGISIFTDLRKTRILQLFQNRQQLSCSS